MSKDACVYGCRPAVIIHTPCFVLTHDIDAKFDSALRVINGWWQGRCRAHTRSGDRDRLDLGNFDENGLNCNDNWDENAYDNLGVFPLMVCMKEKTA